jgi:hypothetical protein
MGAGGGAPGAPGVLDGDDREVVEGDRDVGELQDIEQTAQVTRGVRDQEDVRFALGRDATLLGHERPKQLGCIGGREILQGQDLGDHLVGRERGIHLSTHDDLRRRLGSPFLGNDPVERAGAHGGQAVDVEDRQEEPEHFVTGHPSYRLHGDLPAPRGRRDHVVESHDLGGRLDHDFHIGAVEVEHHEAA